MQKMSNSLTPKVNATPLGIGGTNTGSIMGMFALVTVHYPLPDRSEMPPEGITLQTKALDRNAAVCLGTHNRSGGLVPVRSCVGEE